MQEAVETKKYKQSFDKALELVERNVKDGRVTEPFEIAIDRKTITEETVMRYCNLPFECGLYFNKNNDLVIATGSRKSTDPDYGDAMNRLYYEAENWDESKKGGMDFEDFLRFMPVYAIKSAQKTTHDQLDLESPFYGHNHPSGMMKISEGDFGASTSIESEIDVLFTRNGILLYKVSPGQMKQAIEEIKSANENTTEKAYKVLDQYIEREGIVKKAIAFGTPDMKLFVEFLRGDMTWDDIRK